MFTVQYNVNILKGYLSEILDLNKMKGLMRRGRQKIKNLVNVRILFHTPSSYRVSITCAYTC